MSKPLFALDALCIFIILLFSTFSSHASVHVADNNPLTEGWSITTDDTGVSGAAINNANSDTEFPNALAWEINETGATRLRYEIDGPDPNQYWRFSATLRVVDLNDTLDAGSLIEIANGTTRYALALGSNSVGRTLIKVVTDGVFTGVENFSVSSQQNNLTDYINITIDFDPTVGANGEATVYINNNRTLSQYTGFAGSLDRVNFGDGASAATGHTRYAYVNFQIDPNGDGFYDNDGDGLDDVNDADMDGDGIPNLVEDINGLNRANALDAALDRDNDSWSNLDEYRLVTDINNPASNPTTQRPQQKVFASNGSVTDSFGISTSISGDTAVVGSADENNDRGAAYVFTRSNGIWTQSAELTASDAAENDFFGSSVSISGNTIVVGAVGDEDNGDDSGSVYVFTRNNGVWSEQTKLTASDAAEDDQFGSSVSLSENTLVVGTFNVAGGSIPPPNIIGSAYVFTRSNGSWSEQAKLVPSDGAAGDRFGKSVSISNNRIVVASIGDDDNGSASGSAYVFIRSNSLWSEEAKLSAGDGVEGANFGYSVAISNDTIVVGALFDENNGQNTGSAYVFTRINNQWSETSKLIASDGGEEYLFGNSVSISGDIIVIASVLSNEDKGSAYVFTRSNGSWSEQGNLTANDGVAEDEFGTSLSVSGNTVLIGAIADVDHGRNSGSAYFFSTSSPIVSATLPASRSVQMGSQATAFATVINSDSSKTALSCGLSPLTTIDAAFDFQAIDNTGTPIGAMNQKMDIPANGLQSFVFGFTPNSPFDSTDVFIRYECDNLFPAANSVGLNTLLLSATATPAPDVIGLTTTTDVVAPLGASTLFAVGSANVGATGDITVSLDSGSTPLPINMFVCQTDPNTGACLASSPPAPTSTLTYAGNNSASFAIFVNPTAMINNNPANNRIFIRFTDSGGVVRGATSTAIRTQ